MYKTKCMLFHMNTGDFSFLSDSRLSPKRFYLHGSELLEENFSKCYDITFIRKPNKQQLMSSFCAGPLLPNQKPISTSFIIFSQKIVDEEKLSRGANFSKF